MAYMQRTRILSDSDLDDAATWRERLDLSGKVTCIEMKIRCDRHANRTTQNVVYTLADCISRIELLRDATTPLLSLTGEQLDAMNYWDLKRPNPRRYRQQAACDNTLALYLFGGRGFYDKEYGWDFDILDKVYLEYTYDLQEAVADYFQVNDHEISIYAWQWKGANIPTFKGFFRSKQLDAWTTSAANAEHRVEIPCANPIRRVGVQCATRGRSIAGTLSTLDLQVDKGAYSPVIIRVPMDWCHNEVAEYGLHNVIAGMDYTPAGLAVDLPYWFGYYDFVLAQELVHTGGRVAPYQLVTLPARVEEKEGIATELSFQMGGFAFQKCLRIGFDHEYDMSDILRVPGGKSLDLICTETDAAYSVKTFFQDVVSY